jgi:hypothetical protein
VEGDSEQRDGSEDIGPPIQRHKARHVVDEGCDEAVTTLLGNSEQYMYISHGSKSCHHLSFRYADTLRELIDKLCNRLL